MAFGNYIAGKWAAASSGKTFEDRNPADRSDVIGEFPLSGSAEVDDAVNAATKAFSTWRLVPAPKRGEILYRIGELLRQHKEELARIETRDPDDWPILATAMALDCPVWTEDNDFFGTGVPTWTSDRVELYRPLKADPKDMRRRRAKASSSSRSRSGP